MLFENFMQPCVLFDKTHSADGQGGFNTEWRESVPFSAAIVKYNTLQAKIAEKEGVTEIYTVTFPKELRLEFHDVFKRLEDDAVFRVTSNSTDSKTPKEASFSFAQVSAERWELK